MPESKKNSILVFDVLILGSTSAIPSNGKFLTSQVVNVHDHLILVDCGEGTQFRLFNYKISIHKIEVILISHLHGDHIFGLPGLLNSMNLSGRSKQLKIFGPEGIRNFIECNLSSSGYDLMFDLEINEYSDEKYEKVLEEHDYEIYNFPLKHRILTYGYKINEKHRIKNINPSMIQEYGLNIEQIKKVKEGEDIILDDGTTVSNEKLILSEKKEYSYAYCSDTMYKSEIVPYISGVDLLYHESTYLSDMKMKARERFHSTTTEAAEIAKKANVGKLILGHFSSRYGKLDKFVEEASEVFENVELALEGSRFKINA
ncbi:MAG: ribonuclease Z [Saprospiraceae bacterium]